MRDHVAVVAAELVHKGETCAVEHNITETLCHRLCSAFGVTATHGTYLVGIPLHACEKRGAAQLTR